MVTTAAPTMPVEAASSAPTINTEIPRPPRSRPNSRPIESSSSSATRDFSSMIPMKTKSGTASSVSFHMAPPKIRDGIAPMSDGSNTPSIQPTPAIKSADPARVKAMGNPAIRLSIVTANSPTARYSARLMPCPPTEAGHSST